jgi:4-carboxymuconolactone decarboxylase
MTDQTPAQRMIGDFAPKLVELTDHVLFGDVWARPELSPRDRSLVTCAALVTNGSTDIRAAGLERDVTFTPARELDASTHTAIDAAYHAKYDRYGPQIVGTVTGPHAAPVTLRLIPQAAA